MIDLNTTNGSVAVVIIVFISIAYYNVLELNVYIFGTFKKHSGLYFWSFLVSTWGVAFNGTGYLIKYLAVDVSANLYATLILIGWCSMITGQSVVLYSRLHIVMHNQRRLRLVLIMIITNAIWLHLPVIVLVYGVNSANPKPFTKPYDIYEKLQLSVFFIQEVIISGLYVWETSKRLKLEKSLGNTKTRAVLNHLIYVNILVVFLDISILGLEFANLYDIQTAWKPLVYSVKLKLEFSILNRLVELTRGSRNDSSYTRSAHATQHDVALETFNGERGRHFRGANGELGPEYTVRVGKGENNPATHAQDSVLMKTTEITVHSHRRTSNSDHDTESLEEIGSGIPSEGRDKVRGSASSTSSEVQFARFRN